MKKFLLFCFFIFLAGITFAQDIIVTTISIPLAIIGYTKMHKSADIFNKQCASQVSRQQSYWSINTNSYGIGVAFNF